MPGEQEDEVDVDDDEEEDTAERDGQLGMSLRNVSIRDSCHFSDHCWMSTRLP